MEGSVRVSYRWTGTFARGACPFLFLPTFFGALNFDTRRLYNSIFSTLCRPGGSLKRIP